MDQDLLAALERSENDWRAAALSFSPEQWHYKCASAPEAWSPAECAKHIVLAETGVCQMLSRGLASGQPEPERSAAVAGKEETLKQRIPARKSKAKSPDFAVPAPGGFETPELFLAAFGEARALSLQLAVGEDSSSALDLFVFPHFALGDLTGTQWLWFNALHSERHLNQVRELLASLKA